MQKPYFIKTKETWPVKNAIVISMVPSSFMTLGELIKQYYWRVVDTTSIVETAIELVRNGEANMIIVDDTVDMPSFAVLRQLITDPFTCATPTLAFMLDKHLSEHAILSNLPSVEIVPKPITPAKFFPGFTKLLKIWENQNFLLIRSAASYLISDNIDDALRILQTLSGSKENKVRHFASQILARFYHKAVNDIKQAESVLLQTLKVNPINLGSMLALGDLYMSSAMPHLAYRIFQGVRSNFGSSLAILPDLIQACLFLDKHDEALRYLGEMMKKDYLKEPALDFTCRLHLANGNPEKVLNLLEAKKGLLKKYQSTWLDERLNELYLKVG